MAFVRNVLPAVLTLAMAACSQVDSLKNGKKDDGAAAATSTATSTSTSKKKPGASDEVETTSGAAGALDTPGLPAACTANPGDDQLCVTCQPRDLPVTQCGATSLASIDPDAQCSHDLDQVVCDLGGAEPFLLDLEKRSPLEEIYERVPILVFGAKLLLGSKLESKPAERDAIFAMLETLEKYRLELFSCGDITPMIGDMAAIAEDYNPAFSADQLGGFQTQAALSAAVFKAACKAGTVTDAGLVDVASTLLEALPAGLGDVFGSLDLGGILGALNQGGGGGGGLEGLAAILAGQDLGTILNGIKTDTATSTSTATSAATATSTATSTSTSAED